MEPVPIPPAPFGWLIGPSDGVDASSPPVVVGSVRCVHFDAAAEAPDAAREAEALAQLLPGGLAVIGCFAQDGDVDRLASMPLPLANALPRVVGVASKETVELFTPGRPPSPLDSEAVAARARAWADSTILLHARVEATGAASLDAPGVMTTTVADPDTREGVREVNVLWDMSLPAFPASAPLLVATPRDQEGDVTPPALNLSALVVAPKDIVEPTALLLPALRSQARQLETLAAPRGVACAFVGVPGASLGAFHALYALDTEEPEEESVAARARRADLHKRLGLPQDRPLLRSYSALGADTAGPRTTRLVNVHESCPVSGVNGGVVATVRGQYEYYHYMQDRFDDKGWGCAYRSLMTLISWFRLQHYTTAAVPSHRDIQERLVRECAQPAKLIGSKQWIGALDVSMFLEVALGITCTIENVKSGAELAGMGRMLLRHFETQGTPVMMGGGELAYTLLGVHFNDQTGDIRFLILDPHYTGSDDNMKDIVGKKWCGWHAADKFVKDAFYNLCLPRRPADCI